MTKEFKNSLRDWHGNGVGNVNVCLLHLFFILTCLQKYMLSELVKKAKKQDRPI